MSAGRLLPANIIGLYTDGNNIEMLEEPDSVSYKTWNYWCK